MATRILMTNLFIKSLQEEDKVTSLELLERGADANLVIPSEGIAPFHLAVGLSDVDDSLQLTEAILAMGGDPNVRCMEGVTPVHIAAMQGRSECLDLLLLHGGDPNIKDPDNDQNAFDLARSSGCDDCIMVLEMYKSLTAGNLQVPKAPSPNGVLLSPRLDAMKKDYRKRYTTMLQDQISFCYDQRVHQLDVTSPDHPVLVSRHLADTTLCVVPGIEKNCPASSASASSPKQKLIPMSLDQPKSSPLTSTASHRIREVTEDNKKIGSSRRLENKLDQKVSTDNASPSAHKSPSTIKDGRHNLASSLGQQNTSPVLSPTRRGNLTKDAPSNTKNRHDRQVSNPLKSPRIPKTLTSIKNKPQKDSRPYSASSPYRMVSSPLKQRTPNPTKDTPQINPKRHFTSNQQNSPKIPNVPNLTKGTSKIHSNTPRKHLETTPAKTELSKSAPKGSEINDTDRTTVWVETHGISRPFKSDEIGYSPDNETFYDSKTELNLLERSTIDGSQQVSCSEFNKNLTESDLTGSFYTAPSEKSNKNSVCASEQCRVKYSVGAEFDANVKKTQDCNLKPHQKSQQNQPQTPRYEQQNSQPIQKQTPRYELKRSQQITPKTPRYEQQNSQLMTPKTPRYEQQNSQQITPKAPRYEQQKSQQVTPKTPRYEQKRLQHSTPKTPRYEQQNSQQMTPKSPRYEQQKSQQVTPKIPRYEQKKSQHCTPKSPSSEQQNSQQITPKTPRYEQKKSQHSTPKTPRCEQQNSQQIQQQKYSPNETPHISPKISQNPETKSPCQSIPKKQTVSGIVKESNNVPSRKAGQNLGEKSNTSSDFAQDLSFGTHTSMDSFALSREISELSRANSADASWVLRQLEHMELQLEEEIQREVSRRKDMDKKGTNINGTDKKGTKNQRKYPETVMSESPKSQLKSKVHLKQENADQNHEAISKTKAGTQASLLDDVLRKLANGETIERKVVDALNISPDFYRRLSTIMEEKTCDFSKSVGGRLSELRLDEQGMKDLGRDCESEGRDYEEEGRDSQRKEQQFRERRNIKGESKDFERLSDSEIEGGDFERERRDTEEQERNGEGQWRGHKGEGDGPKKREQEKPSWSNYDKTASLNDSCFTDDSSITEESKKNTHQRYAVRSSVGKENVMPVAKVASNVQRDKEVICNAPTVRMLKQSPDQSLVSVCSVGSVKSVQSVKSQHSVASSVPSHRSTASSLKSQRSVASSIKSVKSTGSVRSTESKGSTCSCQSAMSVQTVYRDPEEGISLLEIHYPPNADLHDSDCTIMSAYMLESDTEKKPAPITRLFSNRKVESDASSSAGTVIECQNISLQVSLTTSDGNEVSRRSSASSANEVVIVSPDIAGFTDLELKEELRKLGDLPGPILPGTRRLYEVRLMRLRQDPDMAKGEQKSDFPPELTHALHGSLDVSATLSPLEASMCVPFVDPDQRRTWREGTAKMSFNYILLDPRTTCNLPVRVKAIGEEDGFRAFIRSIFYIGKGKRSRPYMHFKEAIKSLNDVSIEPSVKVQRILSIWASGHGVVSLHAFNNVIPEEAFTREACMIDAIGIDQLSNVKGGEYYGPAHTWFARKKRQLGVLLLRKAFKILLSEGERQIKPHDVRQ